MNNWHGGTCSHCLKKFDNLSQFLRHVSHSKACLKAHDPEVIDRLKKESRRRSKRQWAVNNPQPNKKPRTTTYIPVAERYNKEGSAFSTFFRQIYDNVMKKVEKRCGEISDNTKLDEGLANEYFDEAMEHAIEGLDEIFLRMKHRKLPWKSEVEVFEYAFDAMEKRFDSKYKEKANRANDNFKMNTFDQVTKGIYAYALDRAFNLHFNNKFKNVVKTAEDLSLDEIFLTLIDIEHYFPDDLQELESKLEDVYKRLFKEKIEELCLKENILLEVEKLLVKIVCNRFRDHDMQYYG